MKMKKIAAAVLAAILILLPGCGGTGGPAAGSGQTGEEAFAAFTRELFVRDVSGDGLTLSYCLTDPQAWGITERPDLGDHTLDGILRYEEQVREDLERLKSFDRDTLTPDQQMTWDILRHQLETELESEGMGLFISYATLNDGVLTTYPQLLADYRITSAEDAENYLALLADLPRVLEEALTLEQARSEAGMFMCEAVLDQVLEAGAAVLENPGESFVISSFEERLNRVEDLPEAEKQQYLDENRKIWVEQVVPAGQEFLDGLDALRSTCSPAEGLWQYKNGADYYAYMVRASSGVDGTMEEIIDLLESGLEESIRQMIAVVQTDPGVLEEIQEFGSREIPWETPDQILEFLRESSEEEFPALEKVEYQVREVPESLEASTAPAYYLTPPLDAPSDNFIYINGDPAYQGQTQGERLVETLAHEGYPGHLLQRNYFNSRQPDPIRYLTGCLGYTEGWANYADANCYEWLGYSPEASTVLRCDDLISSLISARIDVGVHYEGWNTAEVAQCLDDWGFYSDGAEEIFQSILSDPGNSVPYALGELEMNRLRRQAEETLQGKFDPQEFHQTILDCGPAPFVLVERQVEEYMEAALEEEEKQAA